MTSMPNRSLAFTGLVAAGAGDHDRGQRLAADAEVLARTSADSTARTEALTDLASAVARAGDPDHAEALARTITRPEDLGLALARVSRHRRPRR